MRKRGTDNRVVKGSKDFVNKQSSDDPNHIEESISKTVSSFNMNSPLYVKLTAKCKAAARRKFDVYPSAYANIWASKQQKKGKC